MSIYIALRYALVKHNRQWSCDMKEVVISSVSLCMLIVIINIYVWCSFRK